jgi:hypothetical protein
MRLRSLLHLPDLGMTMLSGGHHLDRGFRWIVPAESPDPRPYLAGGELVLTSMSWSSNGRDAEVFVRNLAHAGVSALAVGNRPDLEAVPAALVDACVEHDLPLFAVAASMPFAALVERIMRLSADPHHGELAELLSRHRRLAAADGIEQVVKFVGAELGIDCQVLSPVGRSLYGDLALTEAERFAIVRRIRTEDRTPQRIVLDRRRRFSVFVSGTPGQIQGVLVIDDDHTMWSHDERLVIEELAATVAMELDGSCNRPTRDSALIAAVCDGAIDGAHLRRAGIPMEQSVTVIAAIGGSDPLRETLVAEALLEEAGPLAASDSLWATVAGETVGLLTGSDAGPERRLRLIESIRRYGSVLAAGTIRGSIRVGIAEAASAGSILGALEQARHAAALTCPRPGRVGVAAADHHVSHRILLASIPTEISMAFRTKVLGPLVEYDSRHRSELLPTLRHFLESGGSWVRCARELHLHVNTVRYRMRRIEQLTGRDLRDAQDRMDLALALDLR